MIGDQLVRELQGGGYDTIHVIVTVLCKPTHYVEVEKAVNTLAVALIEPLVLGLIDDVLGGLSRTWQVVTGVLAHDGGNSGDDLSRHVLELSDTGKVIAHGIVHGTYRLEAILGKRLEYHVERAVGQGTPIHAKEFVEGTRVDNFAALGSVTD